jgi:hypothetical protein
MNIAHLHELLGLISHPEDRARAILSDALAQSTTPFPEHNCRRNATQALVSTIIFVLRHVDE